MIAVSAAPFFFQLRGELERAEERCSKAVMAKAKADERCTMLRHSMLDLTTNVCQNLNATHSIPNLYILQPNLTS